MLRRHADAFISDLCHGLRSMARTPGFTAVALLMIALGTGANAAMFSVIDAVMLRSPFTDPGRIAMVRVVPPGKGPSAALSHPQYRSLVDSAPALEAVAALGSGRRPVFAGLGDTKSLSVECFTAGMFRVLGVSPMAGRTFTADEDRPGGESAMVLSYEFWQRELGGAADAVGRAVTLNGVPTTIVGIMPRRFLGPLSRNGTDAWLPLGPALSQPSAAGCAAGTFVNVFARTAPGLSFDGASAQATGSSGIERIPGRDGAAGLDFRCSHWKSRRSMSCAPRC